MIDHMSFPVKNFDESLRFYDNTLALLGYKRIMTFDELPEGKVAGYGVEGKPSFWIAFGTDEKNKESVGKTKGFHIAFSASNMDQINQWYQKCLELGGVCNGKPGPRPEYHPGYYAGFIVDPNGWHIEAVMHHYSKI